MSLRILIVDDSPAMRAYVRRTLQLAGIDVQTVFEASNGREALDVVEREQSAGNELDLIFADINMPVMNGEELMKELQASEQSRDIPVIIISTDASKTRVLRLRELGARGYISKPCAPEIIRVKVEQIVGGRHAKA
jgi:two-component system chemotaxis response regulator CheY